MYVDYFWNISKGHQGATSRLCKAVTITQIDVKEKKVFVKTLVVFDHLNHRTDSLKKIRRDVYAQGFSQPAGGSTVGAKGRIKQSTTAWPRPEMTGNGTFKSRLFRGFSAIAVDWLPVGRHLVHFKNILSVRGGDKGGPIFLFSFLGFQLNLSWFFLLLFEKFQQKNLKKINSNWIETPTNWVKNWTPPLVPSPDT